MIAKAPTASSLSPQSSTLQVILWAAFLACSWTWCIGMFLPVLLVRDYGIMGWVIFAIPNVIGAAAMGWVLHDGMSERITRDHPRAIEWFRAITVIFQLWFLFAYLMPPLGAEGITNAAKLGLLTALISGAVCGFSPSWGLAAWIGSVAFTVASFLSGDLKAPPPTLETNLGTLWLAPVCAFGFALCPYLDPTFHQARQSLRAGPARAAFTLGFGFFFLAMIVFTLAYADRMRGLAHSIDTLRYPGLVLIASHIALQLAYTSSVHARATPGRGMWSAPRLAFVMLIAAAAALLTTFLPAHAGLQSREVIYRSFMAFYGLIFPAYVWLCMTPFRASPANPQHAIRIFLLTIGIAAPFYWMGFIERQELWLAPGLGIVLLSRLFLRPRASATPA